MNNHAPAYSMPAKLAIAGLLAAAALPARAAPPPSLPDTVIRAKVGQGLLMADLLKTAIRNTYWKKGPSDMRCYDAASCAANLGIAYPPANSVVMAVQSDRSGQINITYQYSVLPPGGNILVITPIDSADTYRRDLSMTPVGTPFVWLCGIAKPSAGYPNPGAGDTTIRLQYLPTGCK